MIKNFCNILSSLKIILWNIIKIHMENIETSPGLEKSETKPSDFEFTLDSLSFRDIMKNSPGLETSIKTLGLSRAILANESNKKKNRSPTKFYKIVLDNRAASKWIKNTVGEKNFHKKLLINPIHNLSDWLKQNSNNYYNQDGEKQFKFFIRIEKAKKGDPSIIFGLTDPNVSKVESGKTTTDEPLGNPHITYHIPPNSDRPSNSAKQESYCKDGEIHFKMSITSSTRPISVSWTNYIDSNTGQVIAVPKKNIKQEYFDNPNFNINYKIFLALNYSIINQFYRLGLLYPLESSSEINENNNKALFDRIKMFAIQRISLKDNLATPSSTTTKSELSKQMQKTLRGSNLYEVVRNLDFGGSKSKRKKEREERSYWLNQGLA